MKNRNSLGAANRAVLVVVSILVVILLAAGMWGLISHFSKPASENAGNNVAEQPKPTAPTSPVAVTPAATPEVAPAAATPAADEKLAILDAPPAKGKTMDLLVVDGVSKEPIPGAQILTAGVPVKERFKGATELDGHVKVPLPEKPTNGFNIGVHPKGYVYVRLYWNRGGGPKEEVPASYTVEVERAVRVRGKVVDEEGNPVAGASVLLAVKKSFSNPHVFLDVGGGGVRTIKAADTGIFSYTGIPEQTDSVEIGGWDYKHIVDMRTKPIDVAKLKDGSALVVLKKGVLLEGQVTDAKGLPLLEGTVTLGNAQDTPTVLPPQKLDEQGKFAYAFAPGQTATVSVTSPGYVVLTKDVTMGSQDQQLALAMTLGRKFTGKVVDPSGKGVGGAYLYGISWGGHTADSVNVRTDPDGSFVWAEAPAGTFTYNISANGFRQLENQTAPASEDPVTIKLKAGQHVHGTVVDADTGKPIENFRIIQGIKWNEQQGVSWQPGMRSGDEIAKPGGTFDFNMNWTYPAYEIRIEANGHYPVDSRLFKSSEDDVQLDLKMKPGKDLIATIVDATGKPVVGAKAVLSTEDSQGYIQPMNILQGNQSPPSDEKGQVHFSPQTGDYRVAVFTEDGFVQAGKDDAVESPTLVLQPWGRIEGTLMVGSKVMAGEDLTLMTSENGIYMYGVQSPRLMVQEATKTDGSGHFVFEHVPPGPVTINRLIKTGRYNQSYFRVAMIDVKPADKLTITAGGQGRPVTGKVVLPEAAAKKGDLSYGYSNASSDSVGMAGPPMPENVQQGKPEDQAKWYAEFVKTKPGKAYLKVANAMNMKRHDYPIVVNADGTFRIEDVEPGHYHIQINVVRIVGRGGEEYVGTAQGEFTVSPMEGGRSDEALVVPDLKGVMNGQQ